MPEGVGRGGVAWEGKSQEAQCIGLPLSLLPEGEARDGSCPVKVTVILKKDGEHHDFVNAHLHAGNGVIQVSWEDATYKGRKTRGWPTADVQYYETEDE